MNPMIIVYITSTRPAVHYAGYEPIECAFGDESLIGPLLMDHHGAYSHLEGVALRAYRDHFGALKDEQNFLVTGAADADACFAIAALAGLLPHPSRATEFEKAPAWLKSAMTADLISLAALVNQIDIAPIGVDLSATDNGKILLTWNAMSSGVEDAVAFYAGVDRWRALTSARPPRALISAAAETEAGRRAAARKLDNGPVMFSGEVAALQSPVWGFDVWYADFAPIVVAFNAAGSNITVGCQDQATAERAFGLGGLKNVFPALGEGWGGREAIGGSPRGALMTWKDAERAAAVIAAFLQQRHD